MIRVMVLMVCLLGGKPRASGDDPELGAQVPGVAG